MRALRGGIWTLAVCAGLLVAPAGAYATLTFTQVGPTEVRSGETAQFTMTAGNTGPDAEQFSVGMLEVRAGGEKAVQNPYQSVTTSPGTGSCTIDPVQPPFNYHGAECQLQLAAGQQAQIVAVIQVNESMDHLAGVLSSMGAFTSPFDSHRVWAIYSPRISGSNKIKIKGLPDGCVDRDFKITASAKGAKKITAALAGPYDEWHGRLSGSGFSGKIGAEKGKKLKTEVPLERERAGFYDLKLAAKFENKPKQKTEVNIQRCGVPEG
jgi:hypothetical protein